MLVSSFSLGDSSIVEPTKSIGNSIQITNELQTDRLFEGFDWQMLIKEWDKASTLLAQKAIPFEDKLDRGKWTERVFRILDFAEQNGMIAGLATGFLIGSGDKLPNNLLNGNFSNADLLRILQFITQVKILRFKGRFKRWGALGEPVAQTLYGDPSESFFYKKLGMRTVVDNVLRWARETDPQAKLAIYEDHLLNPSNPVHQKILGQFMDLVRNLKKDGVPLDEVGPENNFWIYAPPSREEMTRIIREFQSLGYKIAPAQTTVAISEKYTTWKDMPRTVEKIGDKLQAQAKVYVDTFATYVDTASPFGIYGPMDMGTRSWPEIVDPTALAHPVSENGQPKPAYNAMIEYLKQLPDK